VPRRLCTTATRARVVRFGRRGSRCPCSAHGSQEEVNELFNTLAGTLSDCTSHVYDIVAADVIGDMAFTAGYERTEPPSTESGDDTSFG
jgi:hypothetical protein